MRCFIQKGLDDTCKGRLELLSEVTRMYLIKHPCEINGFFCYCTFPFNKYDDICIIFGHNNMVSELINQSSVIKENNIYLISCAKTYKPTYFIKGKNVYIAPQTENEFLIPYEGHEFGFSFDITDVELNLYNSRKLGLQQALERCFERVTV